MNIEEIVRQLAALDQQVAGLKNQITNHVRNTSHRVALALKDKYPHADYPEKESSIDEWNVIGEEIHVTWSEDWPYGGHSDGWFQFNVSFLHDLDALNRFVSDCADARRERQNKRAIELREERKRNYMILKQEFEP